MRADIARKCFEHGRYAKQWRPKQVTRLDPRIDWEEQDEPGTRKASHVYVDNGFRSHVLRLCLNKNIGRRWDDVYSDIVKAVRGGSYGRYLMRRALTWSVYTEVYMVSGVPYDARHHRPLPHTWRHKGYILYINPDTGILCVTGKQHSVKLGEHN